MKKWIFFVFILFFSFTFLVSAEDNQLNNQSKKIKVYSSNLWLSKDIFFSGEKIRIYTKFNNNNDFDIKQVVEFYDNQKLIGEKNIEIAAKNELVVWIDTELTSGEHKLTSKIKESLRDGIDGVEKITPPTLENLKQINVDLDTDQDGIGDKLDLDDDNDGISDEEEIKKGSDSKSKLSTPLIEEAKDTVTETTENTKNIAGGLLDIFVQKRESLENQINNKLEEKKKNKEIQIEKEKIDNQSYEIKEEKDLIKSQSDKEDFQKWLKERKKIFDDKWKISEVVDITKKEAEKINKKEITKEEKNLQKASLYQAKYDKIEELQENNSLISYWDNFIYYILLILDFISKSNFLTILFFILLFWIFWKLIKKF